MSHPRESSDPMGHKISSYAVLGRETNTADEWVGADVAVVVTDAGRFLLNILTREAYRNEVVQAATSELASLTPEMFAAEPDYRDSYVVNDLALTDDVLARELGGDVSPGLASALWHDGPLEG